MPLSPSAGSLLYSIMSALLCGVPLWLTMSGRDDLDPRKHEAELAAEASENQSELCQKHSQEHRVVF